LVPGNYKVAVNSATTKADTGKSAESGQAAEPGRPTRTDRPKETIPMKYNAQSTLTAEVKKGGPNSFDFELKSQ
jgi:hypothetical protein